MYVCVYIYNIGYYFVYTSLTRFLSLALSRSLYICLSHTTEIQTHKKANMERESPVLFEARALAEEEHACHIRC